ncbi:hypothetical protein [Brucella intermedia]|uniref:hypothetical protein n=1 Tax=Brucella intermedia TaxID=94625 RepID=UPI00235EBDE5|nr:hypothetical protein [Brucella intermedia]
MIIVYDMHGRILWISTNSDVEAYAANLRAGGYRYLVVDADLDPMEVSIGFHIVDGSLEPRPSANITKDQIKADGEDSAVITGIPEGTAVRIDHEVYEVSGGTLEFTTEHPGTYRISIDAWPLLPFEAEVQAL